MTLSVIGIVGVVVGVLILIGVLIYALYVFWYVPRRQKRVDLQMTEKQGRSKR